MKVNVEAKVKQIMEQAAAREGLTVEEYREKHKNRRPRFMVAYEKLAARTGKSVQQLMDEDLERVRNSKWPGPDCLDPCECERRALPQDRIDHMRGCPDCLAMWRAAHMVEGDEFPLVQPNLPPTPIEESVVRNNPWRHGWVFLAIFVLACSFLVLVAFVLRAIVNGAKG
jgi:hypothetical protein